MWNFKLVDAVGGKGTCANTIFELKEIGSFKGAKRKLKFGTPKPKHYKVSEVEECLQKLSVGSIVNKHEPVGQQVSPKTPGRILNAWERIMSARKKCLENV